ncbi:hypothetical protein P154DRAFT_523604 [Amniculicola lignicola CBS 123094]|uniref:RING-type domain-containing protein n=1 Tax=Amniculicola lignicola CBS 123094 TaxID=1392246 RepID=A0A6A5WCW2_9PLEO|nr:hypothetical protein P154DRAFT_523604 [Amniculicola lignicola CBS 123094]
MADPVPRMAAPARIPHNCSWPCFVDTLDHEFSRFTFEEVTGPEALDDCPVCLRPYNTKEDGRTPCQPIRLRPCGHILGLSCWMDYQARVNQDIDKCMYCRQAIGFLLISPERDKVTNWLRRICKTDIFRWHMDQAKVRGTIFDALRIWALSVLVLSAKVGILSAPIFLFLNELFIWNYGHTLPDMYGGDPRPGAQDIVFVTLALFAQLRHTLRRAPRQWIHNVGDAVADWPMFVAIMWGCPTTVVAVFGLVWILSYMLLVGVVFGLLAYKVSCRREALMKPLPETK